MKQKMHVSPVHCLAKQGGAIIYSSKLSFVSPFDDSSSMHRHFLNAIIDGFDVISLVKDFWSYGITYQHNAGAKQRFDYRRTRPKEILYIRHVLVDSMKCVRLKTTSKSWGAWAWHCIIFMHTNLTLEN